MGTGFGLCFGGYRDDGTIFVIAREGMCGILAVMRDWLVVFLSGCALGVVHAEVGKGTESRSSAVGDKVEKVEPGNGDEAGGEVKRKIIPLRRVEIPKDRDEVVRLQVFLDQKRFGPGFIDGKVGVFTKLAIENYNVSLGRRKDDLRVVAESLQGLTQPYATAVIPGFVKDYVDRALPYKRSLQAGKKAMLYRSVAEFMAERYHTSEDLLIELNGAKAVREAKARTALKVPNIEPFQIEDVKVGRSYWKDEVLSARYVVVDTGRKQVYVYKTMLRGCPREREQESGNGAGAPTAETEERFTRTKRVRRELIASFPITPGRTKFIPKGRWNLKNSVELPRWRYDRKLLETGVRGREYLTIPPGPNNPVGVIWNGLTKSGIGIHGTDKPRTIGRTRSAGCIRLANWDAVRFPELVRPGAVVVVK